MTTLFSYDGYFFTLGNEENKFKARNICIATGISPKIPLFTKQFIGKTFFHAKSEFLQDLNLHDKRITIIGGGQTGVEIFRNALKGKWGSAKSIVLVSSRPNLEPLDESAFTNEYFSPNYAEEFFTINTKLKKRIVNYQKLASDGNTPGYLQDLYNDLYLFQNVNKAAVNFKILPYRRLKNVEEKKQRYVLTLSNYFTQKKEYIHADIVILCTGFENKIPGFISSIKDFIQFDEGNCFRVNKDFSVLWEGHENNRIFVQNFNRYGHGIFEPQTSLMAWRSAVITNAVSQQEIYQINSFTPNFLSYDRVQVV